MITKPYFYLAFLFLACNPKANDTTRDIKQVFSSERKFSFDLEKSSLLTLNVLINGKYPANFIIDNGTVKDEKVVYNREFARKFLLKDTSFISEIHFQRDSISKISFGQYSINCTENPVSSLPQPKGLKYDGIIGLGILKDYLLEVNYQEKYFSFHTPFVPDTTLFTKLQLQKKALCPELEVKFCKKGKFYSHKALLDMGFAKKGFLWGGMATKQISVLSNEFMNFRKEGIKMINGMSASTAVVIFDSVVLFNNKILRSSLSEVVQSGSGFAMSNQIWFGHDVLKNFGKVYFDFNNDIIYLPK